MLTAGWPETDNTWPFVCPGAGKPAVAEPSVGDEGEVALSVSGLATPVGCESDVAAVTVCVDGESCGSLFP